MFAKRIELSKNEIIPHPAACSLRFGFISFM